MTQLLESSSAVAPPKKDYSAGFRFWHELVLIALLVGLLVHAGAIAPRFLRFDVQLELSNKSWPLALLALPMTLIILTSGIDLSVGSTMALSAVAFGFTWRAGVPWPVACGFALMTGTLAGFLNGVFIAYVRVHPLIVTLATLSAYRGLAEGFSHGDSVSKFPATFARISGDIAGFPIAGIVFLWGALTTAILLTKTPLGRAIYAMGFNETACRFSGIPTRRIKLILYTLAGFTAAVAALFFVGRYDGANADVGNQMELNVITAVVLGGTSIFGGRGSIIGTVLGVLLIHETREFVNWHWHDQVLILIVTGVLLILSVLLNTLLTPRKRK
jgi:rhamnose transport system permease protein